MKQEPDEVQIGSKTPMMEQYLNIKQQHPGSLLFYRLGDFYELFFEDAVTAAKALDITLTRRGKHDAADITMCGVPFHSVDIYLQKLIKLGFRVAIVEQLESPEQAKKRGAKSIVKRDVVRIITPGTLIEDNLLDANCCNYLVAVVLSKDQHLGLAWLDISTAEFNCSKVTVQNLGAELARINPSELLLSDKLIYDQSLEHIIKEWRGKTTQQVDSFFNSKKCLHHLQSYFNVTAIDSFGEFNSAQVAACGALVEYVNITQKNNPPLLTFPRIVPENNFMLIDYTTRKSLELFTSSSGNLKFSMKKSIDYTVTNGGGRMLSKYLASPLIDVADINQRLDLVEFFINQPVFCQNLIEILKITPDTERCLSRLSTRRGSPRDLLAIRDSIRAGMNIAAMIEQSSLPNLPATFYEASQAVSGFESVGAELNLALQDQVPQHTHAGGFIKFNYHPKLAQLLHLRDNSQKLMEELRDNYRHQTGIANLKIEHNHVLGYFIEVTSQHASKMSADLFIHKQSLISGVRYITLPLKELEKEIINVKDTILQLELSIFDQLLEMVLNKATSLLQMANKLAHLDVMSSFAITAINKNYTRPKVDNSHNFMIKDGRHLIIENTIDSQQSFKANDCDLGLGQNLWLLTGPNMAGKSTFFAAKCANCYTCTDG